MKTINYILILLFLVLASFNKRQQSEGEYIIWSKERKLQWNDFQGDANNKKAVAGASVGRKINIELNNEILAFDVYTIFLYASSWKTNNINSYILNHEQKHFDLCEFFSRRYRKEMSDFIKQNMNTLDNKIIIQHFQKLYDKYSNLSDSMEIIYDKETNHSDNIEVQELWNKKIDSMLLALDTYNSSRIIITRPKQKGFPRTMIFR